MHNPGGSSALSSSCAVSTGLKQRCQCGFVFNFCFCLTEEMFERIRLLQLVPVRYSRDIRSCSYLQIAVFFQPLHLNLQLSERRPSSNNSVVFCCDSLCRWCQNSELFFTPFSLKIRFSVYSNLLPSCPYSHSQFLILWQVFTYCDAFSASFFHKIFSLLCNGRSVVGFFRIITWYQVWTLCSLVGVEMP